MFKKITCVWWSFRFGWHFDSSTFNTTFSFDFKENWSSRVVYIIVTYYLNVGWRQCIDAIPSGRLLSYKDGPIITFHIILSQILLQENHRGGQKWSNNVLNIKNIVYTIFFKTKHFVYLGYNFETGSTTVFEIVTHIYIFVKQKLK